MPPATPADFLLPPAEPSSQIVLGPENTRRSAALDVYNASSGREKPAAAATTTEPFVRDKPCAEMMMAPSDPPMPRGRAPEEGLELEWVYGYRGADCRDNVFYAYSGETLVVLYPVAKVGVVYDPVAHVQRHLLGHTDDIVSVALSPNKRRAATGQVGRDATIIVWDLGSCEAVRFILGSHRHAVVCLAFSPAENGRFLASVGKDHRTGRICAEPPTLLWREQFFQVHTWRGVSKQSGGCSRGCRYRWQLGASGGSFSDASVAAKTLVEL